MVDLSIYPNPLRLFSGSRDHWFTNYVTKLNIPMHVFTAIRDTQLGQIMYAVEDRRLKQIRAGEDPGANLLDGENLTMFVPLFQTVKLFQDFLAKEELGSLDIHDLKNDILKSEEMIEFLKVKKTDNEWYSSLEFERLDELFLASSNVILKVILPLIEQHIHQISKDDETNEKSNEEDKAEDVDFETLDIYGKIRYVDPILGDTFYNLADLDLVIALQNNSWNYEENDNKTRLIMVEGQEKPRKLGYAEYHGKANGLYSFILEISRLLKEGKKYAKSFPLLPHLITLEMLVMIPQPDKNRISVIKYHLNELKPLDFDIPSEFYDLLLTSYQAYTLVFDLNQRLFQKRLKSLQKTFKLYSRTLWRKLSPKLLSTKKKERSDYELLVATLWTHFRVMQAQAQQYAKAQEHGDHQHNYAYRFMLEFEQKFWTQAKEYVNVEQFLSPIHFWAAYSKIANKEIRSPKEALILFHEFQGLIEQSRILTNKTQRNKLNVNLRDHKSILQTLLSYGLESKEVEIHPNLEKYVNMLNKVIDEMAENHTEFEDISIEEEKKAIESITSFLKAPIPIGS